MISLIGMPRSGTTWVAKGVDRHPDIIYFHEPDSEDKLPIPHLVAENNVDKYTAICEKPLSQITKNSSLKVIGRLPFYSKNHLSSMSVQFNKLMVFSAKVINKLSARKVFTNLHLLQGNYQDATPFWKSIESPARLNLIAKAKPDMRIAYIVRHPCGVINSELKGIKSQKFDSKTAIYDSHILMQELVESPTGKSLGFSMDEFRQMSPAQKLAVRWLIYNEKALDDIEQHSNIKLFIYEDICQDPALGFSQLYQHFNLTNQGQIEQYLAETTTTEQSAYYSINKDPLKSAMKWQNQLSEKDQKDILELIKDTRSFTLFERMSK